MPDLTRVQALVAKDLREAFANKSVVMPTLLLPFIFCVAVPLLMMVGGSVAQGAMRIHPEDAEKLFALYPIPPALTSLTDRMLYVFLNHTFVPMFLILPMMVSNVFALHGVVGEKEHHTLETLLQTPLRAGEFVTAKLLGALVPAVVVAWLSFALFAATTLGSAAALGRPAMLSPSMWLPVMLLLSPAISLAGLALSVVISLRSKTFVQAQQTSGLVVLPFVLIMIGATTGKLAVNPSSAAWSGVTILAVTVLFLAWFAPRLDRERLIQSL